MRFDDALALEGRFPGSGDRARGPVGFEARIAHRMYDAGPRPEGLRRIPRGSEPRRATRPVVATLAILLFALGIYVQVGRYTDCREGGEDAVTCLVTP